MDTCGTRLDLATGNCTRLPTFWPEYCAPRANWNTGTRTFASSSKTVSGGTGSRRERRTNDVLQTGHVEESSSVSLTVSASISAHLVVAVNSAFTTASSSSLTLAVLVSGLSGTAGHGGVVALQRSLVVIRLTSTCTSGASNDDSSSSADFSGWPENILTLAVPISSNSAVLNGAAGSVIGNAVLLAVFSAMLHGVWIILHQSSIKISSCCSRVARCIPPASLPGSMASMYSLMMPPSINAALVLITSRSLSTTLSVALGCIALAVWLCPLCYFSYQLLYRCRVSTSDAGQRTFVLRSSFLPIAQRQSTRQQWTRYWMHPVTTNWAIAADRGALLSEDDAKSVAIFAVTRLEPLFSGFVPRRTWFQLAQWAVSLTSSVAVGLAMGAGSCNAATIGASIALALTALEPLLLLVLRPLRVRFELAVSVFVGCIALAADTFAFLQWSSVASNCVLAGSLMDVVATSTVLLFEACGGRRSMRGELLTTLVQHNEMTNMSQCDRRKQRAFLSQQQALKTLVNLICNS